jgi:hypothetical protein
VWVTTEKVLAAGTTLRVNGVSTPLFASRSELRYFFVPEGADAGPAELLFTQPDGTTVRIDPLSPRGLRIDPAAKERPPAGGDLFFLDEIQDFTIVLHPNPLHAVHWQGASAPFETRVRFHPSLDASSLAIDPSGGFNVRGGFSTPLQQAQFRLDALLQPTASILPVAEAQTDFRPAGNTSYVFDAAGNSYSALGAMINKAGPTGVILAAWQLPVADPTDHVDGLDLGPDQCTLYYHLAKKGSVERYDLCQSQALPAVGNIGSGMFRLLADGNLLNEYGALFDPNGNLLRYAPLARLLALDPDGESFWAGYTALPSSGNGERYIARFDVATGALLEGPINHSRPILRGTVYGEWRAATGRPAYSKYAVVDSVDPAVAAAGTRITVHGAGFVRGLTAAWGNVPVDVTYVNATTVSFLAPPGALLPVLTLVNPGQEPIVVDPAALVAPDIPTCGPGMLVILGLLLACAGAMRLCA